MLKSHTFQYTITFPVFCYIHRGSATGDMWIGLLDLWVAAHWSGHNKSSLAWLIPSGTGDFSEWQSIFLSIIISSLQGYFSFTLDRSCLQRLRTCIPFPSALPKPPSLENYPSCLAFFLSNSRLIASSPHHQGSHMYPSDWQLKYFAYPPAHSGIGIEWLPPFLPLPHVPVVALLSPPLLKAMAPFLFLYRGTGWSSGSAAVPVMRVGTGCCSVVWARDFFLPLRVTNMVKQGLENLSHGPELCSDFCLSEIARVTAHFFQIFY